VFTFMLAGLGLVAMLHTYRNLAGLSLTGGRCEPVFVGQKASFAIHLQGASGHLGLTLASAGGPPIGADVEPGLEAVVPLPIVAKKRGWLKPGRLLLSTRFPLGLFNAWAWVELTVRCLVYPQPDAGQTPLPGGEGSGEGMLRSGTGRDDFVGLRPYRPGDSPRHIAWKASARGGPLLVKDFSNQSGRVLWLDWHDLPGLDTEARLGRLTRWVLDAEAAGRPYGLRLPHREIPPALGANHRHTCLAALATFGLEDPAP
jgi:uncharacterized protein (DUF58 family)